jgi:hypothetical protein
MRPIVLSVALSALLCALGFAAYDRWVVRPAQVVGVVDVGEVYRLKEAEFSALLTSGKGEADRDKALALAQDFAKRLPTALEGLSEDCRCLVLVKSAVAAQAPNTRDLTAALKDKLSVAKTAIASPAADSH